MSTYRLNVSDAEAIARHGQPMAFAGPRESIKWSDGTVTRTFTVFGPYANETASNCTTECRQSSNRSIGRWRRSHQVPLPATSSGESWDEWTNEVWTLMNLMRWLYRGGHPNWLAAALNWCSAVFHTLGVAPNYLVTLEVHGRRSGRIVRLPLVMVVVDGERYLVSMLGVNADWVRNVKAAGGNVTLRHGQREQVHLAEIAPDQRAPILRAYLQIAPGARPHLPVDKDAPLSEFERVAAQFPIFRVQRA